MATPTPLIVALLNRKGGCGKTSCVFHMAGYLSQSSRVLVVDGDPQCSLSQGFFGPAEVEAMPTERTITALFRDDCDPEPEKLVVPTPIGNVSILPGSHAFEDLNLPRPQETGDLQCVLRRFLREVAQDFDIVLLDCPPNLMLSSWNALVAANAVIVPLQPEDFGSQGITHIQQAVDAVLERQNPQLRLLGYLLTMVQKRLGVHTAYERQIREIYGEHVYTATVPLAKDFKESVALRQPVSLYKPRCVAAKAVAVLVAETFARAERVFSQSPEFLYFENRVRQAG